jgi:epsilon-lactone hydrolase
MPGLARTQLNEAISQLVGSVAEGEPTVEEQRAGYDEYGDLMPLPPDASVKQVTWGGIPVHVVDVNTQTSRSVVFYLHGGGYVIGSVRSHQGFAALFSQRSQARVAIVEYALAPERPFPAAVDDAISAYRGLLATGVDPSDIVISGDSAGGGLALALLVALRDAGDAMPAGAALMSPWSDLSFTGETLATNKHIDTMVAEDMIRVMASHYVGDGDPTHPLVSPVYAELSGLPPLQIHVGSDEILLDDSRRIATIAATSGVDCELTVWEEMIHVFPNFAPLLPETHDAHTALNQMATFVRRRTGVDVEQSQA